MGHINSFIVVLSVITAIFAPHALVLLFTTSRNPESDSPQLDCR